MAIDTIDRIVDARGLHCPLPILKTRKVLGVMHSGETLKVIATDPGSVQDITTFCAQTGDALLETRVLGTEHVFIIRKL